MARAIPVAALGKIAVMRARASIQGRGGKRRGGGRRRGRGGFLGGSLGLGTLMNQQTLTVAGVAMIGGAVLGRVIRLPAWLSPIGAAVWLWGWWNKNRAIQGIGVILIAMGVLDALRIPQAVNQAVQQAQAEGRIPFLGGGAGAGAPGSGIADGGIKKTGSVEESLDEVTEVVTAAGGLAGAVRGFGEAIA